MAQWNTRHTHRLCPSVLRTVCLIIQPVLVKFRSRQPLWQFSPHPPPRSDGAYLVFSPGSPTRKASGRFSHIFLGSFGFVWGCSRWEYNYYYSTAQTLRWFHMLHILNSANENCLKERANHTLCLKSDIKSINLLITKTKWWETVSPLTTIFLSQNGWSLVFDVMRMINTQKTLTGPQMIALQVVRTSFGVHLK